MNNCVSISYVFSASIELTRRCHQHCGYCSFVSENSSLLSIDEFRTSLENLVKREATEVILLAGESPQEYPEIQVELHNHGFSSFAEYLLTACKTTIEMGLLPVLEVGYLDGYTLERFTDAGCSVRVNLVCENLAQTGKSLENARNRNPNTGKSFIENLHACSIPYSISFIIGIGESTSERAEFIESIGRLCTADPYLQDIRIVPFQPTPQCSMPDRPPLSFTAVKETLEQVRAAFPVHHIAIPPHLFSRYPELSEAGLNDLGSIPMLTGDPAFPGFTVPDFETIKVRLEKHNIHFYERQTLSTPAALNRTEIYQALTRTRNLIERRNLSGLNLIDNDHCFVCGPRNHLGLHIPMPEMVEGHTCSFTWTPGPAYQGYAGIVHGGILSTLLDEAMAYAVMGQDRAIMAVTADMRIRFLRPTPVGIPLKFMATVVGQRKSLHFARGSVILPDGSVLAEAEGRFAEINLPGDKK